jgi:hypothetical protein
MFLGFFSLHGLMDELALPLDVSNFGALFPLVYYLMRRSGRETGTDSLVKGLTRYKKEGE